MTIYRSSSHAKKRMQQRAINQIMVILFESFGESELQSGGTQLVKMPKKILKQLRHAIDKIANKTLIIGDDGIIITAMNEYKKIRIK